MKTFLQYLREEADKKVVHILRGISGSGKSTLSNSIIENSRGNNRSAVVLSTDRFFMTPGGEYKFDPSQIVENHSRNQADAIAHMKQGTHDIVIDNTNLVHAHMKPYVSAALDHGYDVRFHDIHENDSDNIDVEEASRRMEKRAETIPGSNHGIEVARRQAASYEPFKTNDPVSEVMGS